MKTKKCVVCGEEFVPNSNRQKYCITCKVEVKRKQVKKALIKHCKNKY